MTKKDAIRACFVFIKMQLGATTLPHSSH